MNRKRAAASSALAVAAMMPASARATASGVDDAISDVKAALASQQAQPAAPPQGAVWQMVPDKDGGVWVFDPRSQRRARYASLLRRDGEPSTLEPLQELDQLQHSL